MFQYYVLILKLETIQLIGNNKNDYVHNNHFKTSNESNKIILLNNLINQRNKTIF